MLFLKGLLIGFLLALPVGPTVILCVRYSLAVGALTGLLTGSGAGLADAIYGVIAGYGAFALQEVLDALGPFLHLFSGLILCIIGYRGFVKVIHIQNTPLFLSPSLKKIFLSTFSLTLTSPLTFVGVTALCASFHIEDYLKTPLSPWVLGGGLFMGSCLWWALLSFTLSLFKKKIAVSVQNLIGKISGALLGTMGLCLLGYSFFLYFS